MYADATPLQILAHILIAGFFLVTLWKNLRVYRWNVERMGQWGAPLPHIALPVGLIIQLIGALSVLVNYRADIGAIMLIFFVTAATVIFHRFWQMDDPMRRNYHMLLLLNNVCIVAGLMLVV